MATADELIAAAKTAATGEELDAIAAQAEDRVTVTQAVDARRAELASPAQPPASARSQPPASSQVIERVVTREVREGPLGPNMATTPEAPEEHYFLASDGTTKINAFGEEKGSPEDKKRMASR